LQGLLPGKKLTGNLLPDLLEERRQSLEHYLQRLINSNKDLVASVPLQAFLDVDSHVGFMRTLPDDPLLRTTPC
jgi:hypothetical protein